MPNSTVVKMIAADSAWQLPPFVGNVFQYLVAHATQRPTATALVVHHRSVSFSELHALACKAAHYLHAQGVRSGAVVALTVADEFAMTVALLGLAALGAASFPIPKGATAFQRQEYEQGARATVLVTDAPAVVAFTGLKIEFGWAMLEAVSGNNHEWPLDAAPAAPLLVMIGSGTTGRSKLLPLTHPQQHARLLVASQVAMSSDDRVLTLAPMEYSAVVSRFWGALYFGSCFYLPDRSRLAVLAFCNTHQITHLLGAVSQIERVLAQLPAGTQNALSSVQVLTLTSSPVSDELRARIRVGLTEGLHILYGTNEFGPATFVGPPGTYDVPATVGTVIPGVQVEVVDRNGQPLPVNGVGEVRLRGPTLIDGYLDDPASTHERFREGWFYPGDLGKFDAQGHLIYYGRTDHMMIVNGINLYPAEIERVLVAHPAVADVAVVPLKHRVHHDVPVAAVTLRSGCSASEAELLAFARARLGTHSPHRVAVLQQIPRTALGKLQRAELASVLFTPGTDHNPDIAPAPYVPVQLSRKLNVNFVCPTSATLARLDAWLDRLEVEDREWLPLHALRGGTALTEWPMAWMWRAMLLARSIVLWAGMPLFDRPALNGVTALPDVKLGWQCQVRIPVVEGMPLSVYEGALSLALKVCQYCHSNPLVDPLPSRISNYMQRQMVALKRQVPGGKSTVPVLRVAHSLGIPFIHLGAGAYQLGWGSKARRLARSSSDRDSAMGARLAQDKVVAAALIRSAGLPAPTHMEVPNVEQAQSAAKRLGWPVVVKPVDADRGEGVTVDVSDDLAVATAFEHAQRASPNKRVIVEQQVHGTCHRMFVANGRLLYAVKRAPMSVCGDGVHTVAELVAAEVQVQARRPPWLRSEIAPMDDLALAAIAAVGLTPADVPMRDQWVPLRRIESTQWGGVDEDVTARVHPQNVLLALRAAELFGLEIAGVDMLSRDLAQAWFENAAIVNEVNFAPLLGGAPISRGHIPRFLHQYMPEGARIPVQVFVGDEAALTQARAHWQACIAQEGLRVCLTTAHATHLSNGDEWHMPLASLYHRVQAVVRSANVDALVMVVMDDEFAHNGLPLARVDRLTVVNGSLSATRAAGKSMDATQWAAFAPVLQAWVHG